MNVAVIFARGPAAGGRNINMYLVNGKPVVQYSITAARQARSINKVLVSTDDREIADVAKSFACEVIPRPASAGKMKTGQVVMDALKAASALNKGVDFFVCLSGNTVMVSSYLIDKSVDVLSARKGARAAITVWKSRHDHPGCALECDDKRHLKPLLDREMKGDVFFYDGSVCALRADVLGHQCFNEERWWMRLPECVPLVRPWTTGRDIHDSHDVHLANWWVQDSPVDLIEEVG